MTEYETVFVLRPNLEDARVEEEIEGVRQTIVANSGELVGIERWGRRRLAYEIRKVNEGIYTLVRFRANPSVVQDLERRYRLREDVLRHLTVISQGPPPELAPRREGEGGHGGEGGEASPSASSDATIPGVHTDTTASSGVTPAESGADPEASTQMP